MAQRGAKTKILCPQCKKWKMRRECDIRRSEKIGAPIYCSKKCAGLARRKDNPKTTRNPNWKAMKADYDREYREKNRDLLKVKKSAYFQKTYDPEKAAIERKERMPYHVEYCRQPEYVKYKEAYDRKRRARINYGEFADAFLTLQDLEREISNRVTRYEIYAQNGTLNKSVQRRREYERQTGQAIRH